MVKRSAVLLRGLYVCVYVDTYINTKDGKAREQQKNKPTSCAVRFVNPAALAVGYCGRCLVCTPCLVL